MTSGRNNCLYQLFMLVLGCFSVCYTVPEYNTQSVPPMLHMNVETKENKIVGGYPAAEGEVPWQVGLLRSNNRLFCGGTLLNYDLVLTAAHCVVAGGVVYDDFQVGLGGLSQPDFPFKTPVKKVIAHEEYNDTVSMDNDIALVILEDPVNNFTRLICPAKLPFNFSDDYAHEEVTASGWGRLFFGPVGLPEHLQAVQVKVWPQGSCENAYTSGNLTLITDNMLCAGVEDFSKDACQGDSGGPLVKVSGNCTVIVGITSWGIECAKQNFPGVYTRVTKYLGWINETACAAGACPDYALEKNCTTCDAAYIMNHSQLLIIQTCLALLIIIIH